MPTFAHIESGQALDVWENDSEAEYLARFPHSPDDWKVAQVSDGTLHGARDDGAGGFTNPVIVIPEPLPAVLSDFERLETKIDAIAQVTGVDTKAVLSSALEAKQADGS